MASRKGSTKNLYLDPRSRLYAMYHRTFSYKLEHGYWGPNGEFYEVPTGISRTQSGAWVASTPEGKVSFFDNTYGGTEKALEYAIRELGQYRDLTISTRYTHSIESKKPTNTGIPYVSKSTVGSTVKLTTWWKNADGDVVTYSMSVSRGYTSELAAAEQLYELRTKMNSDYLEAIRFSG